MKVSESIDIEFLQAERLQDFFAFHCCRPVRELMEVSGHNLRVPYSKLFLRVGDSIIEKMDPKGSYLSVGAAVKDIVLKRIPSKELTDLRRQ